MWLSRHQIRFHEYTIAPLAPSLPPPEVGGACDASELPVQESSVFFVQVMLHHSNQDVFTAGRNLNGSTISLEFFSSIYFLMKIPD
jgi:hypothetical protein